MDTFKKVFLSHKFKYLAAFIIFLVIFLSYMLLRYKTEYQLDDGSVIVIYSFKTLVYYANAFSIASVALFLIGILSILNSFGAFDVFSYLFTKEKDSNNKKVTLAEYSKNRVIKRSLVIFKFVPYMVFAVLCLIIYFILTLIIYK